MYFLICNCRAKKQMTSYPQLFQRSQSKYFYKKKKRCVFQHFLRLYPMYFPTLLFFATVRFLHIANSLTYLVQKRCGLLHVSIRKHMFQMSAGFKYPHF